MAGVSLDLSINLGNILTLVSFLVGGLVFVLAVKSDTRDLATKFEQTNKLYDTRFGYLGGQIEDFKTEMKKLSDILIRQNTTDERLLMQGKRIDEMSALVGRILEKFAS